MNNRVKQIRESLNMSQEQFGQMIGLTKSSISNIENKSRNVTEKHIKLICNEFNVNEKWFRFGSGNMFNQKSMGYFDKIAEYYKLDEYDKKIIYEYSRLDANKRSIIKDFISRVASVSEYPSFIEENELVSEKSKYGEKDNLNSQD
jgi:transcriptional regulator with XRE-family HTH domain